MRRIIGLALIVALTMLAALAADLRDTVWASYQNYASPYLAKLPGGLPRQALTPRTVLVLVRGLRLDASRQMPALNALREQGADNILVLQSPTYRLPSWLTLMSGAGAPVHGVTNNAPPRIGDVDTIFNTLRLSGQNAALIGSQLLLDVFGDVGRFEQIDDLDMNARDDAALAAALKALGDPTNSAQLIVLELAMPEEAAQLGESSYALAVAATDRRIRTLAEALDLGTHTLIVTSDRGLTNLSRLDSKIGHDGGDESEVAQIPLVMAGAAVRPGSQAIASAMDLVPTLAALTGSPMPVHNQGQIILADLLIPDQPVAPITATAATTTTTGTAVPAAALTREGELLWASATQLTAFYENWSEVVGQPRFASEMLRQAEAQLKAGDERVYQAFVISLSARARAGQTARLTAERARRLPVVIGAALLMAALVGVLLGARVWQAFAGTLVYLAVWFLLFNLLRDYRHSLTMFAGSDPRMFLDAVARDAAVLAAAIGILAALTTGGHDDALQAITTVICVYGLIAAVQLALAMWFYWQWDITYTWALPDSPALVAALAALTQVAGLSIMIAPGLPSVPVPLVMAIVTLPVYAVLRRRHARNRFERFGGR